MADTNDTAMGEQALASVIAAWNDGSIQWNADGLARVYTEDALMFAGRPGHAVGREAIRAYFASYDGVIESGTMQFVDPKIVRLAPDCALIQGYADFSFRLAGGEQTRSVLRATLVVRKDGDTWRIRQHHFSATPSTPPIR